MMNWLDRIRLAGRKPVQPADSLRLAAVTGRVDDSPGWQGISGRAHDYDPATLQALYGDALTAWRKNPIAWRIIAITTDYVVGDRIQISSPLRPLQRFITRFWHHPQNQLDLRLESLCDELSRAGDLFVLLFRNPADGMSYLRLVTKDTITHITTAENDWERELEYHEALVGGGERVWLSPNHPQAEAVEAVMLHYSVNRPAGALLGESDLATMLPWLLRYSRMLEDRVRLHWAVRAFLWIVNVPGSRLAEKREQYRNPPEAGSIIVKDEGESWQAVSPALHGADAQHDLKAVRGMIDAGSGYPPHWRGEPADANLATATAMQAPTERHLLRRQRYFVFMLQDILYQAYQRAVQAGFAAALATQEYPRLFSVAVPDISRSDNESLARSSQAFSAAMANLQALLAGGNSAFQRLAVQETFKFAGAPLSQQQVEQVVGDGTARGAS
jgi:hypothetical protein